MAPILRSVHATALRGRRVVGGSPRGFDRRVCMIVWPVWPVRHNSSHFRIAIQDCSFQARTFRGGFWFLTFVRRPPGGGEILILRIRFIASAASRARFAFGATLGTVTAVCVSVSARESPMYLSRGPADADGRWSGPLTAVLIVNSR